MSSEYHSPWLVLRKLKGDTSEWWCWQGTTQGDRWFCNRCLRRFFDVPAARCSIRLIASDKRVAESIGVEYLSDTSVTIHPFGEYEVYSAFGHWTHYAPTEARGWTYVWVEWR